MIGCAGAPLPCNDYTVYITPDLSDTMAEDTITALESWGALIPALHYNVVYSRVQDCEHCITVSAATTAWIDSSYHDSCETNQCLGITVRDPGTDSSIIYLGEGMPHALQLQMTTHEIGHAMGLVHPTDQTPNVQIMCPNEQCATPLPTCIDALNWYAIRSENIPVCKLPKGA
jgi:hypothetical protein